MSLNLSSTLNPPITFFSLPSLNKQNIPSLSPCFAAQPITTIPSNKHRFHFLFHTHSFSKQIIICFQADVPFQCLPLIQFKIIFITNVMKMILKLYPLLNLEMKRFQNRGDVQMFNSAGDGAAGTFEIVPNVTFEKITT